MRRTLAALAGAALLVGGAAWWLSRDGRLPEAPAPPDAAALDPLVRELIDTTLAASRARASDPAARARLAMVYQANALPALAETAWTQALDRRDDEPRWWLGLALTRAGAADLDGAIAALERAEALAPEHAPLPWRRGTWLLELARLDEAEAAFERARALDGSATAPRVGLARVHLERRDGRRAAELLEAVLATEPGNGYAHRLLGAAYQQLGRFVEGGRHLAHARAGGAGPRAWADPWEQEILALRTGFGAVMARADELVDGGHADEAVAALRSLRRTFPGDVTLMAKLGEVHLGRGDAPAARRALDEALAADRDHLFVHLNLARLHMAEGDLDGGLGHATRAAEIHPDFAPAWATVLDAHLARGDLGGAETALREIIRCGATDHEVQVDLAAVQYQRGDRTGAAATLRAVIEQDPDRVRALLILARILAEEGDFDGAARLWGLGASIAGERDPGVRETAGYIRKLKAES